MRRFLFIVPLSLLSACAHDVSVMSSNQPASEVMANRVIQTPATYSFTPEFADATKKVTYGGLACGAHSFNLPIGAALQRTTIAATEAGFAHSSPGVNAVGGGYHLRFDLEDYDATLALIPGFLSATVRAQVALTGRVDVTDASGNEVARAIISGDGNGSADGDCPAGGPALKAASEKAIKRIVTDYVYKVINTNTLH